MAKLHPAKFIAFLSVAAAALIAAACSGGEEEAAFPDPATNVPSGLSVTLYASPT